jgi:Flp pilus assembly CpaE family ATPase
MSAIAVCSGKGSPGATFVAVNLAAAMQRQGDEIVLLDLDPNGGDIAAYLGLDPRRGVYPLLKMDAKLPTTDGLLKEAEERDGMLVVGGFQEMLPVVAPDILSYFIKLGTESGRAVVADLGRVGTATATAIKGATQVLVAVRPDLVSVLGAERAIRTLERGGVSRDSMGAVISGVERRRPGDVKEIAEALRIPIRGAIPLHRTHARRALVSQTSVVQGPIAKAFRSLAATLGGELSEKPVAATEPRVAEVMA